MSARKKLNAANFLGSFIVAGLIGGVTGSWIVFWIAFASLQRPRRIEPCQNLARAPRRNNALARGTEHCPVGATMGVAA
jgi:hypothetical protein